MVSAQLVLIASTNSESDKSELDRLWARAAGDVLGVVEGPGRVSLSARFSLERAPGILGEVFGAEGVFRIGCLGGVLVCRR
ncbi:hypothetical protein [Kitasatospora sp. NPDC059673]|uniref:hypothetical protein n=1 Tax=Kitasatospora sp. NPDC059673 TaxID=3346901 RepID=UPI0036CBBFEC